MNTYAIEVYGYHGEVWDYTEQGETPGQAKYRLFRNHEFDDCCSFGNVGKGWVKSCRLVHKFSPADLFDNPEHFDEMKKRRGIPFAFLGQRVEVAGKAGVIVGANYSGNLDVCFDGTCARSNCHPHWDIRYFDASGSVVADYREKKV